MSKRGRAKQTKNMLLVLTNGIQELSNEKFKTYANSSLKYAADTVHNMMEKYLKKVLREILCSLPGKKLTELSNQVILQYFESQEKFEQILQKETISLGIIMPFLARDQLRGCALEKFGFKTICGKIDKLCLVEEHVLNEIRLPNYKQKKAHKQKVEWDESVTVIEIDQEVSNKTIKNLKEFNSAFNIISGKETELEKLSDNVEKLFEEEEEEEVNNVVVNAPEVLSDLETTKTDLEEREVVTEKEDIGRSFVVEAEVHQTEEEDEDFRGKIDGKMVLNEKTMLNVRGEDTEVMSDSSLSSVLFDASKLLQLTNSAPSKKRHLKFKEIKAKKIKQFEEDKENIPPELMPVLRAAYESDEEHFVNVRNSMSIYNNPERFIPQHRYSDEDDFNMEIETPNSADREEPEEKKREKTNVNVNEGKENPSEDTFEIDSDKSSEDVMPDPKIKCPMDFYESSIEKSDKENINPFDKQSGHASSETHHIGEESEGEEADIEDQDDDSDVSSVVNSFSFNKWQRPEVEESPCLLDKYFSDCNIPDDPEYQESILSSLLEVEEEEEEED